MVFSFVCQVFSFTVIGHKSQEQIFPAIFILIADPHDIYVCPLLSSITSSQVIAVGSIAIAGREVIIASKGTFILDTKGSYLFNEFLDF